MISIIAKAKQLLIDELDYSTDLRSLSLVLYELVFYLEVEQDSDPLAYVQHLS